LGTNEVSKITSCGNEQSSNDQLLEKLKQLEAQVKEYESRMTTFQSDIFSKTAENRRLMTRIKDLESKNTLNAKNRNNTSSAFTLPSEFKACWEELVKVLILDAFPDFMDKFQLLVPLAQEILLLLIENIKCQRDEKL
jgi:F0F1-type ATP synthase assembly protein I